MLSQSYRVTLRVIEYFAKSLKVIRNDTVDQGVFVPVSTPLKLCISYRLSWDIQRQRIASPWFLAHILRSVQAIDRCLVSHLTYLVQLLYFGKLLRPKYHEFSLKLLIFSMLQY